MKANARILVSDIVAEENWLGIEAGDGDIDATVVVEVTHCHPASNITSAKHGPSPLSHVSKQSSPVVPQQKRRFFISHILASDLHNLIHMPIRNHEVHVPIVVVVDEVGSKAYVRHCECCQPGLTSTVFVAE